MQENTIPDKNINLAEGVVTLKRIEYLLEQILTYTVGNRYKELPQEEIKDKITQSFQCVDDDMKSYVESLPNAK